MPRFERPGAGGTLRRRVARATSAVDAHGCESSRRASQCARHNDQGRRPVEEHQVDVLSCFDRRSCAVQAPSVVRQVRRSSVSKAPTVVPTLQPGHSLCPRSRSARLREPARLDRCVHACCSSRRDVSPRRGLHQGHLRDASRMNPTFGSWLPHVRIRPSGSSGKGALGGFELDLESNGVDVRRTGFELSGHLEGQHAAVDKTVKGCCGSIIAAPDSGTVAGLAHAASAHRVQEIDIVAGEVVHPLQRGKGCQLRTGRSPTSRRTTAQFFCSTWQ